MTLTLHLPDELAAFLPRGDAEMAAVMSAGLRKWNISKQHQIEQLSDITELLATLPPPEDVLAMRPAEHLAERTQVLLARNRDTALNAEEQAEWNEIMKLEHIMRVAKARAAMMLKAGDRPA